MTVRQIVAKIQEYIKAQALNAEIMAQQPRPRDRILGEVTRMLEKGEGRLPVSTTEIHAAFGNVEKTLEYTAMLDRVIFGSGADIESLCWKNTACFYAWFLFRETMASKIFHSLDNKDVWETFRIVENRVADRFCERIVNTPDRLSGVDPGVFHPELEGAIMPNYSILYPDTTETAEPEALIDAEQADELIEDPRWLTTQVFRHPQHSDWSVSSVNTKRGICTYTLSDGRITDYTELHTLMRESVLLEEDGDTSSGSEV